jgi:hypothetical protein
MAFDADDDADRGGDAEPVEEIEVVRREQDASPCRYDRFALL